MLAGIVGGIVVVTSILTIIEAFRANDIYNNRVCKVLMKERQKTLGGKG
jgi:hypothetical protein